VETSDKNEQPTGRENNIILMCFFYHFCGEIETKLSHSGCHLTSSRTTTFCVAN
jgi:hypothetical protein